MMPPLPPLQTFRPCMRSMPERRPITNEPANVQDIIRKSQQHHESYGSKRRIVVDQPRVRQVLRHKAPRGRHNGPTQPSAFSPPAPHPTQSHGEVRAGGHGGSTYCVPALPRVPAPHGPKSPHGPKFTSSPVFQHPKAQSHAPSPHWVRAQATLRAAPKAQHSHGPAEKHESCRAAHEGGGEGGTRHRCFRPLPASEGGWAGRPSPAPSAVHAAHAR